RAPPARRRAVLVLLRLHGRVLPAPHPILRRGGRRRVRGALRARVTGQRARARVPRRPRRLHPCASARRMAARRGRRVARAARRGPPGLTRAAVCDVAVVGGGPAGIAAALAASTAGAAAVLIERDAALGGNATHALVHT